MNEKTARKGYAKPALTKGPRLQSITAIKPLSQLKKKDE